MPEAPIPGMAFRVRLSKVQGKNALELIFRDQAVSTVDMGNRVTEGVIESALKQACEDAEIEHQVTDNAITNVSKDLFRQAGLGEGKELVPSEFELSGESSDLDRKLAILISTVQTIEKKLDRIEALLQNRE